MDIDKDRSVQDQQGNMASDDALSHALSATTKGPSLNAALLRLATRDPLTGLPNRDLLVDRLTQSIAMGERGHFVVATALIHIDGIEEISTRVGREHGDVLLKTVADRLIGCTRKCDTVARLDTGDFVLITLHNTILAADAPPRPAAEGGYYSYVSDTLAKIQRVLAGPVMLGSETLEISCSIGASIYPQDGPDADTLVLHAGAAMHSAQRNGCNRVKFFTGDPLP